MSSNIRNFALSPGSRRTSVTAYDHHTPNSSDSAEVPVFYRSHSRRAIPYYEDDRTSRAWNSGRFLEDITHAGLYSVPEFPTQLHRIFIHDGDTGRGFNPRLRETHQQSVSPPRFRPEGNIQARPAVENSRSRALSKLKKEIYDPNPTTKLLARKVSSFYRDMNGANALKEMERKDKNEGGKRCAVCLEDFEPKQEVMVTPCKHMFHEDCIMPWLESQGQCPICRSVICEKARENQSSSLNNDGFGGMAHSDVIAGELLSILRAMEEAFHLGIETP